MSILGHEMFIVHQSGNNMQFKEKKVMFIILKNSYTDYLVTKKSPTRKSCLETKHKSIAI